MIELILTFIVGFVTGFCFMLFRTMKAIEILRNNQQTDELRPIYIEKHNNTLYAFDDNDHFICQGTTYQELEQNIKQKYPDIELNILGYSTDVSSETLLKLIESNSSSQNQINQ